MVLALAWLLVSARLLVPARLLARAWLLARALRPRPSASLRRRHCLPSLPTSAAFRPAGSLYRRRSGWDPKDCPVPMTVRFPAREAVFRKPDRRRSARHPRQDPAREEVSALLALQALRNWRTHRRRGSPLHVREPPSGFPQVPTTRMGHWTMLWCLRREPPPLPAGSGLMRPCKAPARQPAQWRQALPVCSQLPRGCSLPPSTGAALPVREL